MRVCSKCCLTKRLEEFPVRADRPSGRGTVCNVCRRSYSRAHYARNVAYYVDKAARSNSRLRAENYTRLIEYLRVHLCVDCGEADVRVLQFDHVDPVRKTSEVSRLLQWATWQRVLTEIDKCVVRCGNCHRRRTLKELRLAHKPGGVSEEQGSYSALRAR